MRLALGSRLRAHVVLSILASSPPAPPPEGVISANFEAWAAVSSARSIPRLAISQEESRVGQFVGKSFADLGSTNQGLGAVRARRVLINGKLCNHASRVKPGDHVTLQPGVDGGFARSSRRRACTFAQGLVRSGQLWVVHEEECLAVVYKPAGIHTKPFGAPLSLEAALPGVLTPPPPDAGVALDAPSAVHRLDARVAGLVVVAKTRHAAAALAQSFRDRLVEKRYRAIALGSVDPGIDEVCSPIDNRTARTRVHVREVTPHVQAGAISTLDLFPETGRRHQLRRHCAEVLGHPLLGDDLYRLESGSGDGVDDAFFGKRSGGLFLQSCEVRLQYAAEGGSKREIHAKVDEARKFARMRERSRLGWEHEQQLESAAS